jgi:membrane-associated phospholipid phosphatase
MACVCRPANPWLGLALVSLLGVGVVGCADLNEIYRITSQQWFDRPLWDLERDIFAWLKSLELRHLAIWDQLYLAAWPYLFFCMAFLYMRGTAHQFAVMVLAIVLAFYMTRGINLLTPTAGPAFFMPSYFSSDDSPSIQLQAALRHYMAGKILQNGILPGTMGFPSLHVSLMCIAAFGVMQVKPASLWLTVPMILLIWLSTILLGWHYVVDGLAGVVVGLLSFYAARSIQHRIGELVSLSPRFFKRA